MDGVLREVNASGQSWQLSTLLFADDAALVAFSEGSCVGWCQLYKAWGELTWARVE